MAFTDFNRLNVADDVYKVVLQDVAFALNTAGAICRSGYAFFTWRRGVGGLREHGTGERVESSIS